MRHLSLGEVIRLHQMLIEQSGGAAEQAHRPCRDATFLMLNGIDVVGGTDEQEQLILDLAAGTRRREDLLAWLHEHTKNLDSDSAV